MIRPRRSDALALTLFALFALFVAGCGGGGESDPPGGGIDDGRSPLVIVPDAAYDGDPAVFREAEIEGTSEETAALSVVREGGRVFTFRLPSPALELDQSFTPGTKETSIVYSQADGRRWNATGGTLRVVVSDATYAQVRTDGLTFAPDAASGAKGGFRAVGYFTLAFGRNEGPGSLTFLSDGIVPSNATVSPIGPGATSNFGYVVSLALQIDVRERNGLERSVYAYLPKDTVAGDVGEFSAASETGRESRLVYSENDPVGAEDRRGRRWVALAGRWRLVSRSRSNVEVELTDVVFVPDLEFTSNPAAGSFRMHGTIRR